MVKTSLNLPNVMTYLHKLSQVLSQQVNPGIKYEYLLPTTLATSEESDVDYFSSGEDNLPLSYKLKAANSEVNTTSPGRVRKRKLSWKVIGFTPCSKVYLDTLVSGFFLLTTSSQQSHKRLVEVVHNSPSFAASGATQRELTHPKSVHTWRNLSSMKGSWSVTVSRARRSGNSANGAAVGAESLTRKRTKRERWNVCRN